MHHRIAPEEIAPTNHGPNIIMFGPSETHHQSKITNNLLDSLFQWWTWHNRHHIGDVNEWMSKCRVCSLKPLLIIIIICVFLLFHHPNITVLSQPYSPVDFDLKRLQSYVLFCSVLFCWKERRNRIFKNEITQPIIVILTGDVMLWSNHRCKV